MSDRPTCDRCDARDSLTPYGRPDGPENAGACWYYCSACSVTVLIAADGRVIKHGGDHLRRGTFVGGGAA
jgi:hypothetical protein